MAYVAASKFVDALALNRQSKQFARIGVELNRATLAAWMIRGGVLIQPLINLLEEHLLQYPVLQMDETTLQVLKEPDRSAESQSYLWVRRGGPPGQAAVLFNYVPSSQSSRCRPNCCKTFLAPCKPTPMRPCAPKMACATPAAGGIVGAISNRRQKPIQSR